MKRIQRFRQSLYVPLLCAALSACSASRDTEALLVSGKKYLEAGDSKSAVIQLKNVLQQQPDLAEARYLLGKTLLESGDPVAGGVELRKALALHHPASQVQPLLARSLLGEGKSRAVIEQFAALELEDPQADAELKVVLARAQAAEGAGEEADKTLRAVLARTPEHVEARLFQVRRLAERREYAAALAQVDRLIEGAPAVTQAWQLKGDLLVATGKEPAAALEAYRKALALKKDLIEAHGALVSIHLSRKDPDAAEAQLKELQALFPGHPQTLYHEAQIALFRGDHAAAKARLDTLLRAAPEDPRLLQLAGLAEFQAGSLLQAEIHLGKALQIAPGLPLARQTLARTHLRAARPEKALAVLQPLLDDKGSADAAAMSLAAEAWLQRGDLARAETLYAQVARLAPQDSRSRTALALTRMARGDVAAATVELELLASSDPGTLADMALISAHLRQKRLGAALAAIDRLEGKLPGQALVPHLRGTVHEAAKKRAEARAAFEQALALDPVYVPAAVELARMDLEDGQSREARQRLERVLAADPRNLHASMAMVDLHARMGASPEEIDALLLDAVKRNPSEEKPRLALIERRLRQKENQPALLAAREAVSALPASLILLEALGRAQQACGDLQQAISTFGKLATQQQDSARPHLLLAGAQLAARDPGGAEASLQRALGLEPASQEVQQQLVRLYVATGRSREALVLARSMQQQRGNEALGFQLEGDIEAEGRRWSAAAAAYRAGLKKAETGVLASRLHDVLLKAGSSAEAADFAEQWIRRQPQDATFRLHLGSLAAVRHDYAQAELHFAEILKSQAAHPLALNNMAWALLKQGKPGAVAHAEKADRLYPGQPVILDTLAQALAQDKQWTRALELQKKAVELDPGNPAMRLGLARIYLGAGQKTQAREELDRLRKLDSGFAQQAEVELLLQTL